MNVAVGVAHGQHGVAGGQGLGPHPTAVLLARSQPPWGGGRRKASKESSLDNVQIVPIVRPGVLVYLPFSNHKRVHSGRIMCPRLLF